MVVKGLSRNSKGFYDLRHCFLCHGWLLFLFILLFLSLLPLVLTNRRVRMAGDGILLLCNEAFPRQGVVEGFTDGVCGVGGFRDRLEVSMVACFGWNSVLRVSATSGWASPLGNYTLHGEAVCQALSLCLTLSPFAHFEYLSFARVHTEPWSACL